MVPNRAEHQIKNLRLLYLLVESSDNGRLKQPPVFCKRGALKKFRKIQRKTSVSVDAFDACKHATPAYTSGICEKSAYFNSRSSTLTAKFTFLAPISIGSVALVGC